MVNIYSSSVPEHRKGVIAVIVAALLWSTGGLFIKLISLNSFQLSFFRSVFAAVMILAILRGKAVKTNGLALLNSLFYAGVLIIFVLATKTTTAANAIFLQYTAPIFVLFLEPVFLKTRFEKINIVTIVICVLGMALFFMGDLRPGDMYGNFYALMSGVCLAFFFVGVRKNKPELKFSSIFYGNILIAVLCAPSLIGMNPPGLGDLSMVAYLGLIQIGLAYIIFTYGIAKIPAIEASLLAMIEPVLNPIWVFLGYGEQPTIYSIAGGLIIVITIVIRTIMAEKKNSGLIKDEIPLGS